MGKIRLMTDLEKKMDILLPLGPNLPAWYPCRKVLVND